MTVELVFRGVCFRWNLLLFALLWREDVLYFLLHFIFSIAKREKGENVPNFIECEHSPRRCFVSFDVW